MKELFLLIGLAALLAFTFWKFDYCSHINLTSATLTQYAFCRR